MVVMLTSTQHMDKPLLVTDLKIHRLAPHKPDSHELASMVVMLTSTQHMGTKRTATWQGTFCWL